MVRLARRVGRIALAPADDPNGKTRPMEAIREPPLLPPPVCGNCGAPLQGKYCYACGQPAQGLVRHFGSVLGDVLDSVFNIDTRVVHTLLPLYLRPGKLTLDYFADKRARYVTPFRLVFFLAIIAFFAIQLVLRTGYGQIAHFQPSPTASSEIAKAPVADAQDTHFANGDIKVNDAVVWNRLTKPLHATWFPTFANDWLNDSIENARANLHHVTSGVVTEQQAAAQRLAVGVFAVAPQVLFLLLPVFALLLKVFYLFKKRLYMEHLIVAMHSHAFLMLSLLVLVGVDVLRNWVAAHAIWLDVPLRLVHAAAWVWVPVYPLLMQKRVYRQGWWMTAVKYISIGLCYSVLISLAMVLALLISLGSA